MRGGMMDTMSTRTLADLLGDIAALEAAEQDTLPVESDAERRARALRELDALLALEDGHDDHHWLDSARWHPEAPEPEPAVPLPPWVLEPWEVDALPDSGPITTFIGGRLLSTLR